MWSEIACEALRRGVCLEMRYDGYSRIVEVHAVGTTKKGNPIMRCWQVRGGSVHNEPTGWKLFSLADAIGAGLTNETSQAPRSGYKPGDKAMAIIRSQI